MIPLTIDEAAREAYVAGRACALTQQEFSLLFALARNVGRAMSRAALLESAWGYPAPVDTRTVDMHIRRLRGKLALPCIETVYRAGYRLVGWGTDGGRGDE